MKGCRTAEKMMKSTALFMAVLFLIFSCNSTQEPTLPVSFEPKVIKAHGNVFPNGQMVNPKVVPAGKPRVVRAGKPKVVPTNTNVCHAGIPKVVKAGKPVICTPGQDGFSLPQTIPAIDSPFTAGIPEVVMAKEAAIKDQHTHQLSFFGKLQGLKSDVINCLLQDNKGNLWFGTFGGGVIKYDGKSFTHFNVREGLSNINVWSMLEDKRGNLWFGTYHGVSKYDGETFTNFNVREGLSDNWVTCILEDTGGNLWFGTEEGGVSKYDGKSFTHFTVKEGLSHNHVLSIEEDKNGHLWFGTVEGVCKYDGKSFTRFTVKEGLSHNRILSIKEDKNGNLWFGTVEGVNKYDPSALPTGAIGPGSQSATKGSQAGERAGGKSFTHFTVQEGLSHNVVLSIEEDKNGNLWFGTAEGVSKYDNKSFTRFTVQEGLSHNRVLSIEEDKNGNLWFGTGNGVNKYEGKSFTHFSEKEGLSRNVVWSILEDKKGNLWIGTLGGGVNKYDASSDVGQSFSHYTKKEGLIDNAVWKIMEDKSGNLWFATPSGATKFDGQSFTHYTEKEGLITNGVMDILEDKKGNFWFCNFSGGACKYDGESFTHFTEKEGLGNNFVMCVLEDNRGNLWFGTNGGGVNKYDPVEGTKGEKIFVNFTDKDGLGNNHVRCMHEDKEGNIWFGTGGGGVSKYDPKGSMEGGKRFTNFTDKDGLSHNFVVSILEDKSGNLWFGTTFGMSKLEKNKTHNGLGSGNIFKSYTYEDGFSGIGVNVGYAFCESRDGTIWIGANDRLTAFHPTEESTDTAAPNIQLSGLTLFNENIAWQNIMPRAGRSNQKSDTKNGKAIAVFLSNGVRVHDYHFDRVSKWYGVPENLSLAFDNNNLNFQYVGITMQSPKKVKYQYKLEGLDHNWSALTSRSEANYGNLPPDQYTFRVKAMSGEGYWSKELNYSFIIRPPWWSTWWFRILSSIFLLSSIAVIIYLWFQYKFRQKLIVEILRQKIATDLHDEIGSNLSSMAFSAELVKKKLNGSREDIEPILNKLVSTFQETSALISDTIWSLNPRNDSFDKLKERMENFTHDILSFKEMEYQFHANGHGPEPALSLDQKRNIYLIYKEAINNIAKHSKASLVNIRLESHGDKLVIKIMDNGVGFDTAKIYEGNGLTNYKSRSIKDSCEVHYFSILGKGTVVKISAQYDSLKPSLHHEQNKRKSS